MTPPTPGGAGPPTHSAPYQGSRITELSQVEPAVIRRYQWPLLVAYADSVPPGVATDVFESSYVASLDVFATGREFLAVGGFAGEVPEPSLPQFIRDVATGKVPRATAAVAPRSRNPDMDWVLEHCPKMTTGNTVFVQIGTTMQR